MYKKRLLGLFVLLACFTLVFALTGCSTDTDDNDNGPKNFIIKVKNEYPVNATRVYIYKTGTDPIAYILDETIEIPTDTTSSEFIVPINGNTPVRLNVVWPGRSTFKEFTAVPGKKYLSTCESDYGVQTISEY